MKLGLTAVGLLLSLLLLGACSRGVTQNVSETSSTATPESGTGADVEQRNADANTTPVQAIGSEPDIETDQAAGATAVSAPNPTDSVEETPAAVQSDQAGAAEGDEPDAVATVDQVEDNASSSALGPAEEVDAALLAHVISVNVRGEPGAYNFSVGISSPDEGCQQYADWWEVLSEDGQLIYRRVLLHSHVNEQPFVRSGGPVAIAADETVWVRAHMAPHGYGGAAFKGSVQTGFQEVGLSSSFGAEVVSLPPLPNGCNF